MAPSPAYTRHGTWWVTTDDGRSLQRVGRDTLTYREGDRVYRLGVEITVTGIAVSPHDLTATDGWTLDAAERRAVWRRARELLDASGDPYSVDD